MEQCHRDGEMTKNRPVNHRLVVTMRIGGKLLFEEERQGRLVLRRLDVELSTLVLYLDRHSRERIRGKTVRRKAKKNSQVDMFIACWAREEEGWRRGTCFTSFPSLLPRCRTSFRSSINKSKSQENSGQTLTAVVRQAHQTQPWTPQTPTPPDWEHPTQTTTRTKTARDLLQKISVVVVIVGAPRQSLIDSHQPPLSPSLLHATALFALFLREHTILTTVTNDDDVDADSSDNEETFLEPTAEGKQLLRRTSCFPPHLQRIKNRHPYTPHQNTFIIEVPLSELAAWDAVRGMELAQRAIKNGMRYQELFCRVVDSILGGMEVTTDGTAGGLSGGAGARDSIDVLLEQRRAQQDARVAEQAENANNRMGGEDSNGPLGGGGLENDAANMGATTGNNGSATEDLPPLLMRRYELRILPLRRPGIFPPFNRQYRADGYGAKTLDGGVAAAPSSAEGAVEGVSLRQIRSRSMGHLVTLRGMIVRSSDVKPACTVATYTCDACGCEIYQVVQNKREFMPQRICPVEDCRKVSKGGDTLHLQTRGSKFVKFQELKLQELPSQVPMGHVPRSMSIHCRGELTRQVSPGDVVTIDGVFLPQRVAESGYRAMKAGLVATTFLEAQNIVVHKKSYDDSASSYLSEEEKAKLDEEIRVIATGDDPVGMLSTAIAPEIFGHEDIKRALLLMLVGGCTRKLPDGMRIRGDINICLMGDPGVAKSQLLKHVASIAPRGVYTTGKGSSGVGLTAAITKDVTTGELALEGGALVLADRGICAIDEFDK
eukprot:scaffold14699_cov179-Alexandrium_tamarense.AAC.2